MSFGYDATRALQPLNYTQSFYNPTGASAANLYGLSGQNQALLNYQASAFGDLTDYYAAQVAPWYTQGPKALQGPGLYSTGLSQPISTYGGGGGGYNDAIFSAGGGGGGWFNGQYYDPSFYAPSMNAPSSYGSPAAGYGGAVYPQSDPYQDYVRQFGGNGYPAGIVNGPYALPDVPGYLANPYPGMAYPGGLNSPMSTGGGGGGWINGQYYDPSSYGSPAGGYGSAFYPQSMGYDQMAQIYRDLAMVNGGGPGWGNAPSAFPDPMRLLGYNPQNNYSFPPPPSYSTSGTGWAGFY